MEKPILRSRSIGTKVSDEEYAQLEKLAEARGITPGEWFREVVLGQLATAPAESAEQVILSEVLGLRMLYLNTVQALGHGGLTTEELQKLIERVDREKQRKARERLAGRNGASTEEEAVRR
jgi:hypothetical protein